MFACVSEGGTGEEMALWFAGSLFIYHVVLGAFAGTGVSLFGPGGEGLNATLSRCVCLPGALFALALSSPGHGQAWNNQEAPSPSQQLFHSQAKHAGPLAEREGSKRPVESCESGVRGTAQCPRVSAYSGDEEREQEHRALPMGAGRPGRWAALLPHPQAWLKSRCVC